MKKLTKAGVKKVIETDASGNRAGALITEDGKYVSNGAFLIPNVYNFNGELKRNTIFPGRLDKTVDTLLSTAKGLSLECTYIRDIESEWGTLAKFKHFGDPDTVVYVNKKYLQVIMTIKEHDMKDFGNVPLYIQESAANVVPLYLCMCRYLDCPVMPKKFEEKQL